MQAIVGALFALAALAWVMAPLVRRAPVALLDGADMDLSDDDAERRELALDLAAGRLSREDFARLTGDPPAPDAEA